jgi:hypothetical protein
MTVRQLTFAFVCALSMSTALAAQPLNRMKGKVMIEGGAPLEADVRIEAIAGPRGGDYLGQRTYSVHSTVKGEWSLIGFKAGAWMFAVAPAGYVPDAIVLPINVLVPAGSSVAGIAPTWLPILKAAPLPDGGAGDWLKQGIAAAQAGDSARVSDTMGRIPDQADAGTLAAAGRICMLARDAGLPRTLFNRALELDASLFRAKLGIGSTALMVGDFSTAAKAFKAARDLTTDKDERNYLTAAIADLSRMDISGH